MDTKESATEASSSATRDILRRLRKRFGQSELSRKTGIPQPRLSRWESGDVPVAADDALKLLEFERRLGAEGASDAPGGEKSDQGATDPATDTARA